MAVLSNMTTSWVNNASWSTSFSSFGWGATHLHPNADSFACLTDYVKALYKVQKDCSCKWCKAEPLERAMAIVVSRKEEGE